MSGSIMAKLRMVAENQHGLFTASQVRSLEIADSYLARKVRDGTIERRRRGVYKIADAPISPQTELVEATLWAQRVGAVVTGETTLELYELAEVNPLHIHLAVPRDSRLRLSGGEHYQLHRFDVGKRDRTEHLDVPTVLPAVAIEHCIALGTGLDLIDQALIRAQALELIGRLTAADLTVKAYNRGNGQ